MTRRGLLRLGAAVVGSAAVGSATVGSALLPGAGTAWAESPLPGSPLADTVLPDTALADPPLIDPYSAAIPLVFPLTEGTYQAPVADNWHVWREGHRYPWNHFSDPGHRAHDGVDVYPVPGVAPPAFAPLTGTVAAVCRRAANTPDAAVTYRTSLRTPPPWDYSSAIDDIAGLPLYGNFVWLYSTDQRSPGYFVFYCHLQDETTLRSLVPDQPVTEDTPLGVVGDTGNAAGAPQLHVEIHYPAGAGYTCRRCTPPTTLTSIDPAASLREATRRPAPAAAPVQAMRTR